MTIGMACWVALLKVLHVATVITQCDLMISVCSACYLIGCMIWSKAAARKTLYQFPDARCHLRHRGEVWMVPRWWGSAQWFGSSRAFFQTTNSKHIQNSYKTNIKQMHQNTSNLRSGLFGRNIQDLNYLRDASDTTKNEPNGQIEEQEIIKWIIFIAIHWLHIMQDFTFKIGWQQPSTTWTTVFFVR